MSYRRPDTGNSMNDYFSSLADFTMLSHNLLEASTEQNFLIWLEKLALIDRRALILFLRKHKDEIPEKYMQLARRRFKDMI